MFSDSDTKVHDHRQTHRHLHYSWKQSIRKACNTGIYVTCRAPCFWALHAYDVSHARSKRPDNADLGWGSLEVCLLICVLGTFLLAADFLNDVHTLQWRHDEHDGVSDHQSHDCLLNRLFRCRSKTSKLRVTGLFKGNSPVTGEFPTQRASNVENVSIWWRHHVFDRCRRSS